MTVPKPSRLTLEQRRAQREADRDREMREAARMVVAAAPPPSEWQLALLARLCRVSRARRAQAERRSA